MQCVEGHLAGGLVLGRVEGRRDCGQTWLQGSLGRGLELRLEASLQTGAGVLW